jgi:phosphohistidine phosphatase
MLSLYVMRHAKSSWKNKNLIDFERPLSKKGQAEIKAILKFLKLKKIKFDLAYVSSAKRTKQTFKKIKKKIKIKKFLIKKKLYLADENLILKLIKKTKRKYRNLLLINHEPTCKNLIIKLIKKKYLKSIKKNFATSSIAHIKFNSNNWANIKISSGELIFFKNPKDFLCI